MRLWRFNKTPAVATRPVLVLVFCAGTFAWSSSVGAPPTANPPAADEESADVKPALSQSGDPSTSSPPNKKATDSKKATGSRKAASEKQRWLPLDNHWETCQFGGDGTIERKPSEQKVETIRMEHGDPITGVFWDGEFPTNNYELALEAQRIEGFDFLCGLTFPVGDKSVTLVVGGWGGGITGISSVDDLDASENDTTTFGQYENGKWYKIRARVSDDRISCWVDGKQVVDQQRKGHTFGIRPEMDLCLPLGIACFESTAKYRQIRWRKLTAGEIGAAQTVPAAKQGAAKNP